MGRLSDGRAVNYRERWYREHDKPYAPPNLDDCPFFARIGGTAGIRIPKNEREPELPLREPGCDDEEIAA